MDSINLYLLRMTWQQQLTHQINILPPVSTFIDDLEDAIAWWFEPAMAKPNLQSMPQATGELVPRSYFPEVSLQYGRSELDKTRYAARNRLCAVVLYHGLNRLVEPYSLRYPSTGNKILHVWEVEKNGMVSDSHKSFRINEITSASVSNQPFIPKWIVEL